MIRNVALFKNNVYICSGNKRIDYETLQNTLAAADDNGGRPRNDLV